MGSIAERPAERVSGTMAGTGIEGLDDVLRGGFTHNWLFLVEGAPGSGKTTLAMQFLLEGVRRGEPVLYVTLSETAEELARVAEGHGWSLEGVPICELMATDDSLLSDEQYTVFHASEVELNETTRKVLAEIERINPARVVFDSLSDLRLVAGTPLRYRRQILALKRFFSGRRCTAVLLDEGRDLQILSLAQGAVRLEQLNPEYGAERRRLVVLKYRGTAFRGGYHDFVIRRGGLEVFPRLVANEHRPPPVNERMASGIAELDKLLGGGIERGTSTLIVGAAGTGKSSLATKFVHTAAQRGQKSAVYAFDEGINTWLSRSTALGMDVRAHLEAGRVTVRQIDPGELSPGELVHSIRMDVERRNVAVVMIDSLNGYLSAMPEERYLTIQLHELLTYLGQRGVATFLIGAHQGLIGSSQMTTPVDASYLADAVILLRYFETRGEVRQAISVVKKRGGPHERTIREFRMDSGRLQVGEPLRSFRGIMTGAPIYEDGPVPALHGSG